MITWEKPSGTMIETNDTEASIEKALSLDWKQVKPEPEPKTKKAAKSK